MTKTAILIDGNSLAYRAFYALPDTMKTASGLTTNAIYGFTSMLMKVLDMKPAIIAVAFDRAAPTFRHKEYKEYKATRQKAPPTLYEQMPGLRTVVNAFGIPVVEMDGFEADDLIGTLAKQAEAKGFDVEIFTGDMDALQLVNDKIKVMSTRKGLSDIVIYDDKAVMERYGITPSQVIDYKALKGDSSDNIPGIKGIGEKTAATLLSKYGTLDNILKNTENVEGKALKEKLKSGVEMANISKMLATIVTNAPISINLDEHFKGIDWAKVMPMFQEFEFTSLIKKYGAKNEQPDLFSAQATTSVTPLKDLNVDYRIINDEKDLITLCKTLITSGIFAFDTETTSTNPFECELVGISISHKPLQGYYIPVGHKNGKQLKLKVVIDHLKPILEDPNIKKIGQNLKYDMEVLYMNGINVKGIEFDTMVAAYTADPTSGGYGLKKLSHGLLGRSMTEISELIGVGAKTVTMDTIDIERTKDYACADADCTLQLMPILKKKLEEEGVVPLFSKIEVPLIEVLANIEENGVSIDTGVLKELSDELNKRMKEQEKNIFAISGEVFNLNSPKQLQVILFDKLKLPITKKTKTGASTDAEVLESLAPDFEIAKWLLEYRQTQKILSTYTEALPTLVNKKTGRIHTSFNQTVTATGRLSSTKPNLQNIPVKGDIAQRIRASFVPAKKGWKLIAADYSQIELRVLAHLSKDPVFVKAFKDNMDIHRATASEVFEVPVEQVTGEMRDKAKVVNFGIIYGMSDYGLSKSLKIKRTEAAHYIETYFKKHAGIKKFIDETIAQTRKDGYVCTLLGRKRPIPDINSPNQGIRQFAERVAINSPVQGTAADIIKVAMINVFRELTKGKYLTKMILQVHDELVLEAPDDEVKKVSLMLAHEMENAIELSVPVKVHLSVGNNWAEAKG